MHSKFTLDLVGPKPRIAVEHAGRGEFVLFMHGIGGNRTNWHEQIAAYSTDFHAAAWDARGYGGSDDYPGDLDFGDFAEDVVRVLDHFRARRAHLVGLSMGGRIAMDFALKRPERLLTLTLCDTHLGFGRFTEEAKRAFISSRKEPLVSGKEPRDIAGPVARTLVSPQAPPEILQKLVDSMCALHKESYIKAIEASVRTDSVTGLERITVPTHVVVGADDTLTPPAMARTIADSIPGAALTVIEGAGHLVNLEKPEDFNTATLRFLRAHAGAAAT